MKCYSDLACAFETKEVGDDVATFSGIASTSDVDLHNDIIEAGAFEPIARKNGGEPDVIMLRDHDTTQVIGGWKQFTQRGNQLLVEGELCLQVEKARETYALLKRGYLSGLSVGFMPDKNGMHWDKGSGRRVIKKALLKECSIVALPANRGARVLNVKSEDAIIELLATSGMCEVEIDILMQDGIDALIELRKDRQSRKGPNVTPKKPWGDVNYADPGYQDDDVHRYPIHTEPNIRAAWSYINMPRNQRPYSAEQLKRIKARIVAAWKDKIDPKGPPSHQDSKDESGLRLPFTGIDDHYALEETSVVTDVRALLSQMKGQCHV